MSSLLVNMDGEINKCFVAFIHGFSIGLKPLMEPGHYFYSRFANLPFSLSPPDILLIALSVSIPKKSFKYAAVCTAGSLMGGCLGYLIGWQFMVSIGEKIIQFYGLTHKMQYIKDIYMQYDAWAIGIAGFTPIPYKVFTISAGAFEINFTVFIIASAVSRAARFFSGGRTYLYFRPKNSGLYRQIFKCACHCLCGIACGGLCDNKNLLLSKTQINCIL